ncbi:MAG: hypothetical protein E7345_05520 [Clostridiales bacterium]|nr:hypothetical protein [Clostridiales bacterium]
MKNKFLSFILALCLIIPATFMFTACSTTEDDNVQIRVQDGYVQWSSDDSDWKNVITIDEILDAIGDDITGPQGEQGVNGKQVEFNVSSTHIQWRYVGDTTWNNLVELEDLDGTDGKDGATWLTGTSTPAIELGNDGDLYLNTLSYFVYKKVDGAWTLIGDISGRNGTDGDDGNKWSTGTSTPNSTMGNYGDLFLNTNTFDIYEKKTQGGWTLICNIKGDEGTDGNGWHSGTGEPSYNLGTTGDFYLNTTTYDIYEKTHALTWTKIGNIQGNKGADGLTPFIGENGNWWIGDTDTGVMAEQRKLCTITFVCDIPGCELSDDLTETTVKYGENIVEFPIPTNVFGYEFTGWYSTTDGEITVNDGKITTLTPITRDIVLKPTFDGYTEQRSVEDGYFTYHYDNYTEIASIDCSWQMKADENTYLPVSQKLSIPNGTTKIEQTAFNSWPAGLAVSNATIPSSVNLSDYNFSQARFISCEFSNDVRRLPKGLFSGNSYITNVKVLNLNVVEDSAFNGSNIKHIQMNTPLIEIGEYAFAECSKFIGVGSYIDINDGASYSNLTSIGKEAFRNCILLEGIEYSYWTELGANVFDGCVNLEITLVDLDEDFVIDEFHQFITEGITLKVHSSYKQFLPTFITDGTLYTETYTPDEYVSGVGVYTYTSKN